MLLKGETKVIAFKGLYQKYNGATMASPGQSYKTHHWKVLPLSLKTLGPGNAMEKDITS